MKKLNFNYIRLAPFLLTLISWGFIGSYDFSKIESLLLDRVSTFLEAKNEYTIIYIDGESDQFLGQRYPYSLSTYNKALSNLSRYSIKGLSLIIDQGFYTENDSKYFEKINNQLDLVSGYKLLGDLVDAGGIRDSFSKNLNLERYISLVTTDSEEFSKDGKVRRLVLDISGNPTFTRKLAEAVRGDEFFNINGSFYSSEADANFTYTSFFKNVNRIKFVPFHLLVTNGIPKELLNDKNILIGASFRSSTDYSFQKPDGALISHLQMYVEQAESLIQDKSFKIYKASGLKYIGICLSVLLFFLIFKYRPSISSTIFLSVLLLMICVNFLLVRLFNVYFEVVELIIGVTLTYYLCLPFKAISENKKAAFLEKESKLRNEVEELKNNFMNLMSHDLKTPIARISSLVENLKNRKAENEEHRRYLDLIDHSTDELNKFISEILDISKIEAKKFNIQKSQKDLNKTINDVVKKLNYFANQKSTQVETDLETLFPITFDENLISRVVFNLVENAIKYGGDNNKVTITTRDTGDFIDLVVSDTGPGIEPQSLQYIFDKFYRVKNNKNETIKGSGLGLYLVKYFVEAHGGRISVTSSNKGTNFKIKLVNA